MAARTANAAERLYAWARWIEKQAIRRRMERDKREQIERARQWAMLEAQQNAPHSRRG